MADGVVNLAGKVVDGSGADLNGKTVELYTSANWEAGGAATDTDTTDADGLWAFASQALTGTWIVVVTDGTKKFVIDSRNKIQLTELDLITSLNTDTIYPHTASGGLTVDAGSLIVKDATPDIEFKDESATAGDVNASIVVQATDAGDGTEDVDVTFNQQIAGALTAFLTADADAGITFGSGRSLTADGGGALTGTWTDLGAVTTVDINGGTIDGAVIGGATPAAGSFTTLDASGDLNLAATAELISVEPDWLQLGSTSPMAYELIDSHNDLVDLTATDFITVTVPNAPCQAWLIIDYIVNDSTQVTMHYGQIKFGLIRQTGENTALSAVAHSIAQVEIDSSGGSVVLTSAFGLSALSGAVGATQTFTVQATVTDTTNGNPADIRYRARMLLGNGPDNAAKASLPSMAAA